MKTMKWLALFLAIGLAVPAAMGSALVTKGSNELAVDGKLDFATEAGADFVLKAKYAYFFWDRVAMGARMTMHNNEAMNHFGIGATIEYNFVLARTYKPLFGTDLVPYLGAGVDYRHAKLFDVKESAVVFIGETGLKFFLTDSTAVTLSLVGELATEDIYADDLEATDKDLSLQIGMRFYF
jgi:outer membrane protein W